jgi:hypothetical protein
MLALLPQFMAGDHPAGLPAVMVGAVLVGFAGRLAVPARP